MQYDPDPQRLSKRRPLDPRRPSKQDDYRDDPLVARKPKNSHARSGGPHSLDEDTSDNAVDRPHRKSQAPGTGARNAATEGKHCEW